MHICQYNKTWSNQDKFPAGNSNWHNVKTMPLSHNNTLASKFRYLNISIDINSLNPKRGAQKRFKRLKILTACSPKKTLRSRQLLWIKVLSPGRKFGQDLID